ncbi:hypothetical protein SO802_005090 [Lithocarpus litseifolius]|uniref:Uncharacterized protein n=1 Tax=Lithocarpus litseifolius TaxID=425828 RepID=A0AAW2DH70_9ROSI
MKFDNHMYTCPLKECMVKKHFHIDTTLSLSFSFLSPSLFEANSKPRNKGKKSRKEASLTRFSGTKSFQFQLGLVVWIRLMNLWSVLRQEEENLVCFRLFEKLKILVNECSIYNWKFDPLFHSRSDSPA